MRGRKPYLELADRARDADAADDALRDAALMMSLLVRRMQQAASEKKKASLSKCMTGCSRSRERKNRIIY